MTVPRCFEALPERIRPKKGSVHLNRRSRTNLPETRTWNPSRRRNFIRYLLSEFQPVCHRGFRPSDKRRARNDFLEDASEEDRAICLRIVQTVTIFPAESRVSLISYMLEIIPASSSFISSKKFRQVPHTSMLTPFS